MVTNEYRFSDSKIIINPNNLPTRFTNRQIIAVWPPNFLDEIAERSNKLFKYVSLDMYKNRTGNSFRDEGFYEGYVDFISSIDATPEIDTPYILIDGYGDVLEALRETKMNYILYTPMTVYSITKPYGLDPDQFNDIMVSQTNVSFMHIMSNIPVDLFIINNIGLMQSAIMGILDIAIHDREELNNQEGGLYNMTLYMDKIK